MTNLKSAVLALMAASSPVAFAQNAPERPEMQEGYVCSVFLRDIGMSEKALVFAVTHAPDCHGEWEWQHNFVCPESGGQSTNGHACSKTEYSPEEIQMIHDQLMTASVRRTKVFAVQGECQHPDAMSTCFTELGFMNLPFDGPKPAEAENHKNSRTGSRLEGSDLLQMKMR